MSEKTVSVQAKTAARWWADQLRGGVPKMDNGDPIAGGMAALLTAQSIAEQPQPDAEAVDRFEALLAERVQAELDYEAERHPGREFVFVDTDYSPGHLLSEVMRMADVLRGALPWKTRMVVTTEKVEVACGYGAEDVELALVEEGPAGG